MTVIVLRVCHICSKIFDASVSGDGNPVIKKVVITLCPTHEPPEDESLFQQEQPEGAM